MILILDNNEYRRHTVYLSLYRRKCLVSEQSIDDMDYYTKPNMTVYLNPTQSQVSRIRKEDTICVIATNKKDIKLENWMIRIPLDNSVAVSIYNIFNEKCKYGNELEIFGIVCMREKEFALGGVLIKLTKRERQIVRLFLYNAGKKFNSYDACNYFDFAGEAEKCFIDAIYEINLKCVKGAHRIPLFLHNAGVYYVNPEVLDY